MRAIPTRIHGILDYAFGALAIAAPWLFGFGSGGLETWLLVGVGAAVVVYSLFTDYELGVVRRIQMPVHLWLDAFGGVLLAVSPWLFGFEDRVWLPHLLFGLTEIVVASMSQTVPSYERRREAHGGIG